MAPTDKPPGAEEEGGDGLLGGDYAVGHDRPKGMDNPSFYGGHGYNYGENTGESHLPKENKTYDTGDVNAIGDWSTDRVSQLQQWLVAAGYLDQDVMFTPGTADKATKEAYGDLLGDANVAGQDWETTLDGRLSSPNAPINDQGKQRAPMPIALTNAEDLKAMFQNTAWDMLGTTIEPETIERMVGSWHDEERVAGSEAIAAERAAMDSGAETFEHESSMQAPGTEEKVKQAVYDVDPMGAEAIGFAKAHDEWLAQLAGPTNIGRQRGQGHIPVRGA